MQPKKKIKNTFCIFQEKSLECIKNRIPNYISKSKSAYFYTEDGVYRLSDHWGRTANSKWRLIPNLENNYKNKLGFAFWIDFHEENPIEKLYFLEVNFGDEKVYFNHKNNKLSDDKSILRTSSETTVVIRQIRKLFENDNWTKHYKTENIKQKVIAELIYSNKSLNIIKSEFV